MLKGKPIARPPNDHGLDGALAPSLLRTGVEAMISAMRQASPSCPHCLRDLEVRITDDKVRVLAVVEQAIDDAQACRDLRQADQRKDEFLATQAHELRNHLAPIRNVLRIMCLARNDSLAVEKSRNVIERQVEQMARLVNDLLDVSRIAHNKLELRKERIKLEAVIESAVETSRPLIEQEGHELTVTLPAAPAYLEADLSRLAQAFSNLLNNSAKYTDRGGRIWLTATPQGGELLVQVRDTGVGIAAEAIPHLFEMFSQVDRKPQRAQGGLGIGLTLVRRLIEMHGGRVEARSEGIGRGSEFAVTLPLSNDESRSEEAESSDGREQSYALDQAL